MDIRIADYYLERACFGNDELFRLKCPKCGFDNTHLESVEYFGRHEDAEHGTHAKMDFDECQVDDCLDGNPSDRRDGLILHFSCEDGCEFDTLIFQHKGLTFFKFKNDIKQKPKTHKEKYHEYLQSEKWDNIRRQKLAEANYKCQLCNASSSLSVHHRTYENVFNEQLSDLIALCDKCHKKFHNIKEETK